MSWEQRSASESAADKVFEQGRMCTRRMPRVEVYQHNTAPRISRSDNGDNRETHVEVIEQE